MEKEYWKDNVMASLDGIKQAEPNPFLFTRIESKLDQVRVQYISSTKLKLAAVGLVILIAINAWAITGLKKNYADEASNSSGLSYFQSY